MTDDQGWGDTGYNGHPVLKTPVLDEMAAAGIRFDRFYAAASVCSPTRGSCLTGRHPNRYRCFDWGCDLPLRERTLAEALADAGYATGHFGKWHLGGLPHTPGGSNRSKVPFPSGPPTCETPRHPGNQGFTEWFSHGNWFDLNPEHLYHNGRPVGKIEGETSEIVVGRSLEFIRDAVNREQPFLAVIWFPSPHGPFKAADRYRKPYTHVKGETRHGPVSDYYGEMAAVDAAMGTLREELRRIGIARDTLLWFCSDNGSWPPLAEHGGTGGLSGHKFQLREGGIRVPGILEWPGRIKEGFRTSVPAGTVDFYPTLMDLFGLEEADKPGPIDGTSLLPLIDGNMERRPEPLAFEQRNLKGEVKAAALVDNEYKLLQKGSTPALFNLEQDAQEQNDLRRKETAVVKRMKKELSAWQDSVETDMEAYEPE